MAMSNTRLAQTFKAMFDDFEQRTLAGQTSEEMKEAISLELAEKIIAEVKQMTVTIVANAGATPVTVTSVTIT